MRMRPRPDLGERGQVGGGHPAEGNAAAVGDGGQIDGLGYVVDLIADFGEAAFGEEAGHGFPVAAIGGEEFAEAAVAGGLHGRVEEGRLAAASKFFLHHGWLMRPWAASSTQ